MRGPRRNTRGSSGTQAQRPAGEGTGWGLAEHPPCSAAGTTGPMCPVTASANGQVFERCIFQTLLLIIFTHSRSVLVYYCGCLPLNSFKEFFRPIYLMQIFLKSFITKS